MKTECVACAAAGVKVPAIGTVQSGAGPLALCRECMKVVRGGAFTGDPDSDADGRARLSRVFHAATMASTLPTFQGEPGDPHAKAKGAGNGVH